MITAAAFSGKRYAVLGLARSGLATVESLLASGAQVTAWDRQRTPRDKLAGRCALADPMEIDLAGFDGVVVSPGVPLNTHPLADKARAAGVPVIGDIELFARARPELPAHRVVGITGTNGKSTTTALVTHILQQAGVPALMGGNIGLPILAQEPLPEGGVYVLELSSYQIDLTYSLDCDVAVLLNVTPDHLDRYDGFADYAASKGRLFAMQSAGRVAVVSASTPAGLTQVTGLAQRVIRIDAEPQDQSRWPALQGPHNLENVLCARAACAALGLPDAQIEAGLASYRSLPHRMEVLAEHGGVLWVNDSKATNAASTAPALAAWPATDRARIHWICGGVAKADNLDECLPQVGNVAAAYTIGEAGPMFADLLSSYIPVERCEMLCEAADRAFKSARPGDVVLFSPACASFDQFRDYEVRGDAFREIVERLTGHAAPASRHDSRSAA
ncbi:MAG: UDP-N-acetylmuramoyl-L-alanine--D-glutamate ligase [Alteraurantiacibacter sp.]